MALVLLAVRGPGDPVEPLAAAGPEGPVVAGGGQAEAPQPAGLPRLGRLNQPVGGALVGHSPVSEVVCWTGR